MVVDQIIANEDNREGDIKLETLTIFEQQQQALISATQEEEAGWFEMLHRKIGGYFWVIFVLFIVIAGIGMALIPHYKSNRTDGQIILKSASWNSRQNYPLDNKYSRTNMNYGESSDQRRSSSSPDSLGHVNIYIRRTNEESNGKYFERVRFPSACYNRRRFPIKGPFFTFIPWVPIVIDRYTKQTIIYSSTGVYIIPPLIDAYGKVYSVAELIASGYASLVSSGVSPSGSIDMRPFFRSTPIMGPSIPTIDPSTGGFLGSVRTNFRFSIRDRDPELVRNNEVFEQDEYKKMNPSYRPPSYNRYYHRQRSSYTKPSVMPTTPTTTEKSTPTPNTDPNEVHRTLIIDKIYPYSTSKKPIISANYSFPGPLLEAYENDTFVIRVINRLDVPSTLHWHGMFQLGTPDMDGAVGVTQCAIPPNHEMIYRFKAAPAGTTWYHGHLLEQYTDGLYGPLIVRPRNDSNQQYYDKEEILMIADWYNEPAHSVLLPWYINTNNPNGNEPSPDAIVVNGKFTQSLFISLSGVTRIRFRVINTAAFSMYSVSIDGLPLHIIEVDSCATSSYTVSSFSINVAQRVSFYIDLSELDQTYTSSGTSPTNSIFIRIQAVQSMYPVDIVNYIPPYEPQRYPYPTFFNPLYLAILSFDSSNFTPSYAVSDSTPTLSNAALPKDTNLLAARPIDQNINGNPQATHYLGLVIAFNLAADGINRPYINNVIYSSDANYMHIRPDKNTGITSDLCAPLLHQMAEKPQGLGISLPISQSGSQLPIIQSDQNGHYLVPYQAVVDIFLNNTDGGEHPFHLHGHNFWIISTSDYPEAESLYSNNYIQRDTISVPALGWAKIRFVANNPGAWFFHCHIEWHMSAGLAMAFLISPEQLRNNSYTISENQKHLCQALRQFNTNNNKIN